MGNITAPYINIVNEALIELGEDTINAFDVSSPSTSVQKIVAQKLSKVVKRVLRMHPWGTASSWKQFGTADQGTVPDNTRYTIAYTMPTDFMRLTLYPTINGSPIDPEGTPPAWTIMRNQFLTYTTSIEICYVAFPALDTGTTDWDEELCSLMGIRLAYEICYPITRDSKLKQLMYQNFQDAFTDACIADERNDAPRFGHRGTIARAKYYERDHVDA